MERLGVFGSAFNPPTLGHVILVKEAVFRLGLDRVLVIPTGDAWHKETDGSQPRPVRLALARAAFMADPGIEVSDLELRREGPSYTCDTLEEIRSIHPDSSLIFLTGADAAVKIADWRQPRRVLELASFAVADRRGVSRDDVRQAFEDLGSGSSLQFFEMPEVAISSTLVRGRIASGGPWAHLVPPPVAEIIDNESLYGKKQ